MFVKVNGDIKNAFGRTLDKGVTIETSEIRGRELIRMDLAEFVSRDIRKEYQAEVSRIKNKEVDQPKPETKRNWFGRLFGL